MMYGYIFLFLSYSALLSSQDTVDIKCMSQLQQYQHWSLISSDKESWCKLPEGGDVGDQISIFIDPHSLNEGGKVESYILSNFKGTKSFFLEKTLEYPVWRNIDEFYSWSGTLKELI